MGQLSFERYKRELADTKNVWMNDLSWKERAIIIREYNEYFKYSTYQDLIKLVRGKTYTGPSYLLAI